jgi:hypothetical protein
MFRLRFQDETGIDLKKDGAMPSGALATGIAYYHRIAARDPLVWNEPPNLLNPFWRATLVPIDIDEKRAKLDPTPGPRQTPYTRMMLEQGGMNQAARTRRLLIQKGYTAWQ